MSAQQTQPCQSVLSHGCSKLCLHQPSVLMLRLHSHDVTGNVAVTFSTVLKVGYSCPLQAFRASYRVACGDDWLVHFLLHSWTSWLRVDGDGRSSSRMKCLWCHWISYWWQQMKSRGTFPIELAERLSIAGLGGPWRESQGNVYNIPPGWWLVCWLSSFAERIALGQKALLRLYQPVSQHLCTAPHCMSLHSLVGCLGCLWLLRPHS